MSTSRRTGRDIRHYRAAAQPCRALHSPSPGRAFLLYLCYATAAVGSLLSVYAIRDNDYLLEFIQRTTAWPSDPTSLAKLFLQDTVMAPFSLGLLCCRSEKDLLKAISFCSNSTRHGLNSPVWKANQTLSGRKDLLCQSKQCSG